jgi:hypothetical protein
MFVVAEEIDRSTAADRVVDGTATGSPPQASSLS